MTNEEAIARIEDNLDQEGLDIRLDADDITALKMACEALKKENAPEASREAEVINKIKELIAEEIDNSRKRSWAAKQEYREGLAAAIGIIDAYLLRQQEGKE